mmetsp:Transcript_16586/g.29994  ORF Transcript_16586/g.29994 Transcript_16586/m.29994 type:complete len:213 (-) Transcript_16586:656-1294(-)
MHFECTDSCDNDGTLWLESGRSAFNVEKLFHSNVGTKASFRDDVSVLSHNFECNFIRHDTRISSRNICKWTSMNEYRRTFDSLHQCRHECVLHEHSQCTTASQIIGCDWYTVTGVSHNHVSKLFSQIWEIRRECQYRHDFTCDGNIESSCSALLNVFRGVIPVLYHFIGALTYRHLSQMTITGIQNSLPRNGIRIYIQSSKLGLLFFCQITW